MEAIGESACWTSRSVTWVKSSYQVPTASNGSGEDKAYDFVGFPAQCVASIAWTDRYGNHDALSVLMSKSANRGQHRAARGQAVVDDDDFLAMKIDHRACPSIQAAAPVDLALFPRGDFLDDLG